MNKLRILVEHPPTRCEICHQSDLFNKGSGYCLRCSVIIIDHTINQNNLKKLSVDTNITIKNNGSSVEIIIPYYSFFYLLGTGILILVSTLAIYFEIYKLLIITLFFLVGFVINLVNKL